MVVVMVDELGKMVMTKKWQIVGKVDSDGNVDSGDSDDDDDEESLEYIWDE